MLTLWHVPKRCQCDVIQSVTANHESSQITLRCHKETTLCALASAGFLHRSASGLVLNDGEDLRQSFVYLPAALPAGWQEGSGTWLQLGNRAGFR